MDVHVTKRGEIVMRVSRLFFTAFRRFTATPNRRSTVRIGTFDIYEVRRGYYRASPDRYDDAAKSEAGRLAERLVKHIKCMLMHGTIFAEPNSYHNWFNLNRRVPTFEDLVQACRQRGIQIPVLNVSYPKASQDRLLKLALAFKR